MAKKSTVTITYQFGENGQGLKQMTVSAAQFRKMIGEGAVATDELKAKLVNFAALQTSLMAVNDCFQRLTGVMGDLAGAYAVQQEAETKLETVMRQRMGATDDEIQSIKDLASAQQSLGVIGDEVQLAGAQQIATFLKQKGSIDTLLPAMNNLLAQQRGLSATGADAVSIANMMGKAMQGQVAALQRAGIVFSDAQKKVLQYGTESERAAVLAQVITENVGEMNASLAQTDSGKQKQLSNSLGDLKEKIGALASSAMPFMTMAAACTTAITGVMSMCSAVKALTLAVAGNTRAAFAHTGAVIKDKAAAIAHGVASKAAAAGAWAWNAAQKALNFVLSANPIGLVVMAIGALVYAIVQAYQHCEGFRKACDAIWASIKPLANAIVNGLAKAFQWLAEKVKIVWNWIKKILGLSGSDVEIDVDVVTDTSTLDDALGDIYAKYENAGAGAKTPSTPKTSGAKPKSNEPLWTEDADTLEKIEDNLKILQARLQSASVAEAAAINKQIALWNEKAEAIRNAGADIPTFDAGATTLKAITDNLEILRGDLLKASVEEAAAINQEIAVWEEKEKAIRNAGMAIAETSKPLNQNASTLAEINENLRILQSDLQKAGIEEAAVINGEIDLWNEKADAIKNAGKEATKTTSPLKNVAGLLGDMGSLMGNLSGLTSDNAAGWLKWGASVMAAIAAALPQIAQLIGGNIAQAFAGAAAQSQTVPFPWNLAALAASMAAVGAAVASIPKFADGGIAYGPTLGLFGEYAGASNNPEVVAPLDKLRGLLEPAESQGYGEVTFRISGESLVGVLNRRNNRTSRT